MHNLYYIIIKLLLLWWHYRRSTRRWKLISRSQKACIENFGGCFGQTTGTVIAVLSWFSCIHDLEEKESWFSVIFVNGTWAQFLHTPLSLRWFIGAIGKHIRPKLFLGIRKVHFTYIWACRHKQLRVHGVKRPPEKLYNSVLINNFCISWVYTVGLLYCCWRSISSTTVALATVVLEMLRQ